MRDTIVVLIEVMVGGWRPHGVVQTWRREGGEAVPSPLKFTATTLKR